MSERRFLRPDGGEPSWRIDAWIIDRSETQIPYSIGQQIVAAMPAGSRPSDVEVRLLRRRMQEHNFEVALIRQRMRTRHLVIIGIMFNFFPEV